MWSVLGSIITTIGSGISAFFGFKGRQADVLQNALKATEGIISAESGRAQIAGAAIIAEATSGSWIAMNGVLS